MMRRLILTSVSALALVAFAGLASAQQGSTGAAGSNGTAPLQATPAPMNPDQSGNTPTTGTGSNAGMTTTQGGDTGTPVTPNNQTGGNTTGIGANAPLPPVGNTAGNAGNAAGTATGTATGTDTMGGSSTPNATAATGSTTEGGATTGTAATGAGDNGKMATMNPDQYRSYSAMEKGSWQGTIAGGYTADQLIGKDIKGPDGNEIASVADLVIEPDNTIKKVIVDVGGFLGIGAKPVALDIDQLQKPADGKGDLTTSMTKEQLKALPRYKKNKEGYYVSGDDNG